MRVRIFFAMIVCLSGITAHAQAKRFDSSLKVGKAGFRVYTSNKSMEKNSVTISPIGFDNNAREINIEVKGKIYKAEVDDLNNDGYPELVMYVYNGGIKNTGTVVCVSSDKNKGFAPIFFPDIQDDLKLRVGYTGNDEFFLMEGTLMRKFPVYSTADTANITPTGQVRQIQYRVVSDERGTMKFKVTRSYEMRKQ